MMARKRHNRFKNFDSLCLESSHFHEMEKKVSERGRKKERGRKEESESRKRKCEEGGRTGQ